MYFPANLSICPCFCQSVSHLSLILVYSGNLLISNGSILSSNGTKILTTDDDHFLEKRTFLFLSKLSLTVAGGFLDYTDIRLTDGAYLHLTESGSTILESKIGTYTFSFVQVGKNSSILFDYSSAAVPSIYRKRMFSSLPGIFLKVTNVLKISESGKVHSNSEGYQWTDSGSDSGIGMGLLGTSGGGGGGYGGKGGSGLSAPGK